MARPLVTCTSIALVVLAGCTSPGAVDAGPNLLDPTFGTAGTTLVDFGCTDFGYANGLVAIGDSGFVAGGKACNGWALTGFTAQGTLDPSYGSAGTALFFADAGSFVDIRKIEARPDGRVIARTATNGRDFVRQFTTTGAIDPAFATAADSATAAAFSFIQGLAIQPDGKVVIATADGIGRLLTDGSDDSTFGGQLSLFGLDTFILRLLVHPDGRIVVIGMDTSSGAPGAPFVMQLAVDGTPDSTFGVNGLFKLPPPLGASIWLHDAAVQSDGKIVIAGSISTGSPSPAVWRLTHGGTLDLAFGKLGIAEARGVIGEFFAVAAVPTGIVAVGNNRRSFSDSWLVARFDTGGIPDTSFGNGGAFTFDVGVASSPGGATSLAVTPRGYVIAGRAYPVQNGPSTFGLAKVLP